MSFTHEIRLKSYKENILDVLNKCGYYLKLTENQINKPPDLKLAEWFIVSLSEDNCLTPEEITELKTLQDCDVLLSSDEIDSFLEQYISESNNSTLPYSRESKDDELKEYEYQWNFRTKLHEFLEDSNKELKNDLDKLDQELVVLKEEQVFILQDLFEENKKYSKDLVEMRRCLNKLNEQLSELGLNNDITTNEGSDIFLSDKLDSSNLSNLTFQSVSSGLSTKDIFSTFLCQKSFIKYENIKVTFIRILRNILEKSLSKIGGQKSNDIYFEDDLEMYIIMDRLRSQTMSTTTTQAQLEAIREARNEIKYLSEEVQSQGYSSILSLRYHTWDSYNESIELENSFEQDNDELSDICKTWAEHQTLQPVNETCNEQSETYDFLKSKMIDLIRIMKSVYIIDMYIKDLFNRDKTRVVESIETYQKFHEEIKSNLDQTKNRIRVMKENNEDFQQYSSLSPENTHPLLNCLAAILHCNSTDVVKAEKQMTEDCEKTHKVVVDSFISQFQTLVNINCQMDDFYKKEMYLNQTQDTTLPKLCDNARMTLVDMSNGIEEALETLSSLKMKFHEENEQNKRKNC